LSLPVPVHPALHGDRRLQHLQPALRLLPHGDVRAARLRLRQTRLRAGAADPRLYPRAVDGREPAARHVALARRSVGVHQPLEADQHGLPHCRRDSAGDHRAARAAQEARRSLRRRDLSALLRLLLLAAFAAAPHFASAQAWPAKPLRLVAPYAAGGPIDISARLLAAKLQESLGQPVVVENRPGAGGNIGVELIAKGPADGYNLVMSAIATLAINPSLYPSLPYDPLKDLRHVTLLVQVPNVLVVTNELPAKNVKELIALARERPGKLDFGSGSSGSTGHLAGEMFKMMTGTFMVHIPYKGSAPALADMMAGRIHLMFDNLASARS